MAPTDMYFPSEVLYLENRSVTWVLRGNLVYLGGLTSHRMALHRPVDLFLCPLSIANQKSRNLELKNLVKEENDQLKMSHFPFKTAALWLVKSWPIYVSPVQMPRFREASKNDPRYAHPSTMAASITCPLFCVVGCEVEEEEREMWEMNKQEVAGRLASYSC